MGEKSKFNKIKKDYKQKQQQQKIQTENKTKFLIHCMKLYDSTESSLTLGANQDVWVLGISV